MVGNIAENGALLLRARSFSCDTDGDAEELLVCPWPPEDRHEKTLTFLWTLMGRLLLLWWRHMSENG